MAKRSWYSTQAEAEAQRNATLSTLYAGMTERELVAELHQVEADDREQRLDRNAPQANWERIVTRDRLVRAELAARRQPVSVAVAA